MFRMMEGDRMSNTIIDIAAYAGVSKSTVSRVISGKGYTSEEARQKVLRAIKELQYKPNAVARAMVSKRTNNIGVIIYRQHYPIASHPFYGQILDAILMKAASLNYSVFVTTDKEMSLKSADFMLEKRVDGLILISRLSQEVIGYIDDYHVPYVLVNGTVEKDGIIQLFNHDQKGAFLVADFLYQLGHQKIFVLAGPQKHRSHHTRLKGFCQRIQELGGVMTSKDIYFSSTSTFENGYKGLADSWEHIAAAKPTALFATNDMLAMGAMRFLLEKGLRIPDDIAVVGFDNIEFSKMSYPPLTTVHVEKERMGEDAVSLLDQLIKKENIQTQTKKYEPKLVIRMST
jgi:LacI family transcriptional regulator/LacI family purine nucleotide synthesis repressor